MYRFVQLSDFQYELPPELIAQAPLAQRSASRLLHLDGASGGLSDRRFLDLPGLLRPDDLLVFNDTRVIPARLFAEKETGGRVEILVERVLDASRCLAQVRASKPPRPGMQLRLAGGAALTVLGREGDFYLLGCAVDDTIHALLERQGHMPLPPYIDRTDRIEDRTRYQTVYARAPGAVAAPTAGLHFDAPLLAEIARLGVRSAYVTLHVAAGTFQPVRCQNIEEHRMHHESVEVDAAVCTAVADTRTRGGRVIAVGTTALRSLESAARNGTLAPLSGDTDLFIHPGFLFHCVDALITNFHLPGSSLLMLVSAFAGHAQVMAAYRHAVAGRYRFFSYGDAMFITPMAGVHGGDGA